MGAHVTWVLPNGVEPSIARLLLGRGLRGFADGCMAVLLPAYLLALGFGTVDVGLLSSATLAGSALATLALGTWGHRAAPNRLLRGAALLMAATGAAFAGFSSFWPLAVVAFFGTLNPSSATSACSCRSSTRASPARPPGMPAPRCSPVIRWSAH